MNFKKLQFTFLTLAFFLFWFEGFSQTESKIYTLDNSAQEVVCPGGINFENIDSKEEEEFKKKYKESITKLEKEGTVQYRKTGQIYTIPTVVHIVHSGQEIGTTQNPDISTVNSYIEEANRHFSHTQAGAKTYSNPNYGIDTEIQFCLASTDPDGNYTSGVVRHYLPNYYSTDYWSLSLKAGELEWDKKQYLNIWINYTTNVLGISMGERGVIMRNIGFNGVFFCHEVGHYLGLSHTFEGGCTNNDCLTDGDGICDTPAKSSAGSYGTCLEQNNCVSDEDDTSTNNPYRSVALGGMGEQPDMIENYMDYTQPCYDTYTLGQKNKMRFYYENYYTGLASSIGCNPQTRPNLDVAINYGIDMDIPCGENSSEPTFTIENTGVNTITSLDIDLYFDGVYQRTQAWTGTLQEGEIEVITLNSVAFPNGQTDFEIRLANPNGQTDELAANNSQVKSVYLVQGGIELELTINFDGLTYLNRWELLDESGNVLLAGDKLQKAEDTQTFICADPGICYNFVMYDTYTTVNGYTITDPNGTVLVSGDNTTSTQSTNFCINDPCSANGGDADNDGFCANVDCDDNDFYQGAPQTSGTACDDGDIATENDVIQTDNCTCAGTLICLGYTQKDFDEPSLTHQGTGSSETLVTFNGLREDVSFQISNIDEVRQGNAIKKYADEVTVSYRNASGNMVVFRTYNPPTSQVSVEIPGPLTEVIVSLADGFDGSSVPTQLIELSVVGSCALENNAGPCANTGGDADGDGVCANVDCNDNNASIGVAGTSCNDGDACTTNDTYNSNCNCVGTFADADNDGVCDTNDQCPGSNDTIDTNGNGIPDGCDTVNNSSCNTCSTIISNLPHTENFESGAGSTCQPNSDDFDWAVRSSGTPSADTGPTVAYQGSSYFYTEASSPNYPSKTAVFQGACFNLNNANAASIDFWYHMYGAAMGTISLEISANYGSTWSNVWSLTGDQGNSWQKATVDLISYAGSTITYRFTGETGSNYTSDFALDQITVSTGGSPACTIGASCTDNDVCTTGDAYDANCNCVGVFQDSDGDGICDANDTNNGGGCTITTLNFAQTSLTHERSGSSSISYAFPNNTSDVSFNIVNINQKTNGKASRKYTEQVTVTYVDGTGATQTYGVYSGANTSSKTINISGEVQSVKIILEDIFDGSTLSSMVVDLSSIMACVDANARIGLSERTIDKINIMPNPVKDITQIQFNSSIETNVLIELKAANAAIISQIKSTAHKGNNSTQLDLSGLPAGLYFIKVQTGDVNKISKVIKVD